MELTPTEDGISRYSDGSLVVAAVKDASSTPVIAVRVMEGVLLEETANEAPYRAGKYVRVASSSNNCTTSWFVKKNGINWGMTAGHCGPNGSGVHFAGVQKGDIQWNQLFADTPALADAALFDLGAGGTAYLYRSTTINRAVTGKYNNGDLVAGFRTCTRGAFTGDQVCGSSSRIY